MVRSTSNGPAIAQPEKHMKTWTMYVINDKLMYNWNDTLKQVHYITPWPLYLELITDHPNTAKKISNLPSQDTIIWDTIN